MATKKIINPELKKLFAYWIIFFLGFYLVLQIIFKIGGAVGGAVAAALAYGVFELILRGVAKKRNIPPYLTEEEVAKTIPGKTMRQLQKEQGNVLIKPMLIIVAICLVIIVLMLFIH